MNIQHQDKEYLFNLVIDYLTGTISDEARLQLTEWRKASTENEQLFAELQKTWDVLTLSNHNETFDEQRAYRFFKERINAETGMAKQIPIRRNRIFRQIATYAAVLLPLAVLGYFTYLYFTTIPDEHTKPLQVSEISVPNGSKTQVKLQDGTTIWLNAGSNIRYDSGFGHTNRTLSLSGEAYFEVTKNEYSPFIVEVGSLKIKVLGTRFNVNAYEDNDEVTVALQQGAVEMTAKKSEAVNLTPGNVACYNTITGKTIVSADNADGFLAWMDNKLTFYGETFNQIIRQLERNYNVKVNISNHQIKERRFAGDFTNNETIEQIFAVMSVNGKFRYRINGNIIDIY